MLLSCSPDLMSPRTAAWTACRHARPVTLLCPAALLCRSPALMKPCAHAQLHGLYAVTPRSWLSLPYRPPRFSREAGVPGSSALACFSCPAFLPCPVAPFISPARGRCSPFPSETGRFPLHPPCCARLTESRDGSAPQGSVRGGYRELPGSDVRPYTGLRWDDLPIQRAVECSLTIASLLCCQWFSSSSWPLSRCSSSILRPPQVSRSLQRRGHTERN